MMTDREVKQLQRELNEFTKKFLRGVTPLIVDGDKGHSTRVRIRTVKYHLGNSRKNCGAKVGPEFRWRLAHPRTVRRNEPFDRKRVARAMKRRVAQRTRYRRNALAARRTTGVSSYRGGRPVANWIHPYLDWANSHGWQGQVVSGFREPAYSESLCYRMCGRPSCPGKCAGRASGHSQSTKPAGCIDVSDYVRFGQLMRQCPYSPRLFNALGARDPVHFSVSGR